MIKEPVLQVVRPVNQSAVLSGAQRQLEVVGSGSAGQENLGIWRRVCVGTQSGRCWAWVR